MFKNLQGLCLLWNSTFLLTCFLSLGISRHCILILHWLPTQHNTTLHFITAIKDTLSKILSPCPFLVFHICTQLFQQSQVTSKLVTIFPYQTVSQSIQIGATGHFSAIFFLDEHQQNCWFVGIQKQWSCPLQGYSCRWMLLAFHVYPLWL